MSSSPTTPPFLLLLWSADTNSINIMKMPPNAFPTNTQTLNKLTHTHALDRPVVRSDVGANTRTHPNETRVS